MTRILKFRKKRGGVMKLSIFSAVSLFIALLAVTVVIGVTQPALAEEEQKFRPSIPINVAVTFDADGTAGTASWDAGGSGEGGNCETTQYYVYLSLQETFNWRGELVNEGEDVTIGWVNHPTSKGQKPGVELSDLIVGRRYTLSVRAFGDAQAQGSKCHNWGSADEAYKEFTPAPNPNAAKEPEEVIRPTPTPVPDNNLQGVSTSTATSTPTATPTPMSLFDYWRLRTPVPLPPTPTPTKKPSVAVRDVTVSSNADGSAVVSWKKSVRKKGADRAAKCASAKLREYRYKVVDTSNPTRVEIARGKATSTSVTVTGLTAGNQYQVLVWSRSADECDNGKWSNFRRATWTQAGG